MKQRSIISKNSGNLPSFKNRLLLKYVFIWAAVVIGYAALFSDFLIFKGICAFKALIHIPCPGCGMSRSSKLLFSGQVWHSIMLNPLAILFHMFVLISVFWMIRDLVIKKETLLPQLKKNPPVLIKVSAFAFLLANWIWNIAKGL